MLFVGLPRVGTNPPNSFRHMLTWFLGELLASAGDDGNVILWVPSENHHVAFGSEGLEDKEAWRTKHMCRSLGTEIYDLAWSPDASFFIIGSMDNIARIYNAGTGEFCLKCRRFPS
jgi:WD40 repeat protein